MSEPSYSGNFDQQVVTTHTMVGTSDDFTVACGYISFVRKIIFGSSGAAIRLSIYSDSARTLLAYRSEWMSNGDSEITPIPFIDDAKASLMYCRLEGTAADVATLTMSVLRLS